MVDVLIILAIENEGKYAGRTLGKLLGASHESEEQGVGTEVIVADNSTDDSFLGATKYVKIDRQGRVSIFPQMDHAQELSRS